MKTLITVSFAIMLLVMMALSASAALDPEMILYFAFDEQLDGKKVADLTGGGNDGKLKLGAKITNEPAEVYKGAGALKIFNNISAQFLVESFKEMDNYRENTYTFWLYIYGVRDDPCCPEEIVLQKANILVGDAKGNSPAIFVTDPGLGLTSVRNDPCCAVESILKKANVMDAADKGSAPGIFITDPGLTLVYKFTDQGAIEGEAVGPGGNINLATKGL
jgi:hypothetical protein